MDNALVMRARRVICTKCNNDWMSVLQDQAKPILEGMIEGVPRDLSPSEQATLANWATMTAIMAEYAHGETVERFRREYFYREQTPPPNTFVYLLQVETPLSNVYCGLRLRAKDDPETVHNYVGFLSLQALGVVVVQGTLAAWQRLVLSRHERMLLPVWVLPLEFGPRHWPPPEIVSPNRVIQFVYELVGHDSPDPARAAADQVEAVARERRPKPPIQSESEGPPSG